MRKLWIVLGVVLLLAAGTAFAADVGIAGEFLWWGNADLADGTGQAKVQRARLKFTANPDDYNTVYLELRGDGVNVVDDKPGAPYIKNFKVTTDITGALGLMLPVTVETVVGVFDTYFTGWYNQTESGYAYYYGNDLAFGGPALVYAGQVGTGAAQVNVGIGPATIHLYSDMPTDNFMAGLEASLPFGLDAFLAYGAPYMDVGAGKLSVEAKYGMTMGDLSFAVPAFFRYDLGTSVPYFGVGGGVDYGMFHVAFGLQGDDTNILDHIVGEASVSPVENLELYTAAYFTLSAANAFTGWDISARYDFGATTFALGYVIGGPDNSPVDLYHDKIGGISNGLYLIVGCPF